MPTIKQTPVRKPRGDRGAALIFALSMLVIFGAIGVAYVGYMNESLADSDFDLRKARARELAVSGIEIAAAGLREEVLSANNRVPRGAVTTFDLPIYKDITQGDDGIKTVGMNMTRVARATVSVYDEGARVNLNHAPVSALQKVLGVDGDTARTIAGSVPRGAQGPDARWFVSIDELLSRGLLTKSQYDLVVPESISTLSVVDHANPTGHFNVNGAAPSELAAMLNVTLDQAGQIQAKGPFASLEALGQAVASVTGAPAEAVVADTALGLKARCFRVVSHGFYARAADQVRYDAATTEEERDKLLTNRAASTVEAVLQFQDDGGYEILYWNADPDDMPQATETPENASPSEGAPMPEAPATNTGSVTS